MIHVLFERQDLPEKKIYNMIQLNRSLGQTEILRQSFFLWLNPFGIKHLVAIGLRQEIQCLML